jgi:alkylated DNA repair dioxygenase AlkB
MRLRPYPPKKGERKDVLSLELEPRSAYFMRDEARWGWQHSIAPTAELRYSITFRTKNENGRRE